MNSANESGNAATTRVGFLVMAAGRGSRFGGNKLMAPLATNATPQNSVPHTLLHTTLMQLPEECPARVICDPENPALISAVKNLGFSPLLNPDASQGLGTSIATGVRHTGSWQGWVICLADMPWISTATYRQVAMAVADHRIVIPEYSQNGTKHPGHPVGFGSAFAQQLQALSGDRGGKAIVSANQAAVLRLNVKDPAILLDIDYPDDINNHRNR